MQARRIERLSADDLMLLAAEASGARMQFAAIAVLDGAPSLTAVRTLVASRLAAVPRLRERLVRVPVGRPIWLLDPDFAVERHVDAVGCAAPGDHSALLAAAATIVEDRLSLARPPWRITLVTGLAGGRSALVIVLHHVLADGMAGLAILSGLVDGARAAPGPSTPVGRWPTAAELRADARVGRHRRRRDALLSAGRVRAAAAELLRGGLLRPGAVGAPRCSINAAPVGTRRGLAVAQVDLAAVVAAARSAGGTVNDVLLTAVTGALAEQLAHERLDRLMVSIPISARPQASTTELGNRVGVLPVSVPVPGPARRRLAAVVAITRSARTDRPGASTALYGPVIRILAGVGAFGWFIGRQRLVNTFLTNLRGPREPLSLGGFRITDLIPVSALSGNVGVAFAVLSYAGRLTVTVIADPNRLPDARRLADLVQFQLDEFTRAARAATPGFAGGCRVRRDGSGTESARSAADQPG